MRWKFTERQQKQRKSNILVTAWCFSERSHISNQQRNCSDGFHDFDSVGSHRTPDQGYKAAYRRWKAQPRSFYFHNFASGSVKGCLSKYVCEGTVSPTFDTDWSLNLFWGGFPFCFSLQLFPKKRSILMLQITRKHKLRKANSGSVNICLTCGCYVRIQNPVWPYEGTKN